MFEWIPVVGPFVAAGLWEAGRRVTVHYKNKDIQLKRVEDICKSIRTLSKETCTALSKPGSDPGLPATAWQISVDLRYLSEDISLLCQRLPTPDIQARLIEFRKLVSREDLALATRTAVTHPNDQLVLIQEHAGYLEQVVRTYGRNRYKLNV